MSTLGPRKDELEKKISSCKRNKKTNEKEEMKKINLKRVESE
jgi:hypothetical protein